MNTSPLIYTIFEFRDAAWATTNDSGMYNVQLHYVAAFSSKEAADKFKYQSHAFLPKTREYFIQTDEWMEIYGDDMVHCPSNFSSANLTKEEKEQWIMVHTNMLPDVNLPIYCKQVK